MADVGEKLVEIHPGEILSEEFMLPLGLSVAALAAGISVPVEEVQALVEGRQAVTPALALRLGERFGTEPAFWLNLQAEYDRRTGRASR